MSESSRSATREPSYDEALIENVRGILREAMMLAKTPPTEQMLAEMNRVCDLAHKGLGIVSADRYITEKMVEAGARRMVGLVEQHIIDQPRLLEWQPWAGSARAILEAALGTSLASSTTRVLPNPREVNVQIEELILSEKLYANLHPEDLRAVHEFARRVAQKTALRIVSATGRSDG